MKDIELLPMVGVLHALPDHIKTSIEAYGAACARMATKEVKHQEQPKQERGSMSEYGWLIENGKKQGEGLAYRFVDNDNGGMTGWTSDHNKALRFARRQDAEQFAYHDEDAFRITQHAWDSIPSDHGIKE